MQSLLHCKIVVFKEFWIDMLNIYFHDQGKVIALLAYLFFRVNNQALFNRPQASA